ncbi:2-aminoethylphosphonate--pyruvate transaminase [Chelativorans intermedius]|uniref:2-aminoethylphosphonate--pyruvate transaminase n=1 Tax=Chelativorans intermedius TaxID=515947 RepID=A0ABV6D2B5_9HYPH|nr:2-aminoethylphosphonate--pyruvate transaminase [Chelativorans intermedius]MCT8997404.1 2-aminoethylphosphonate--pyruvate transaminase [Chelativorans intermedius]
MANGSSCADIVDPPGSEPYLLTPGPLTTSPRVKAAMLRDWGSWDGDFRAMTATLRRQLLELVCSSGTVEEFDCVPMQGSGTFVVEAMLGSFIPRDGRSLVLANGAYGQRIARTLDYLGRSYRLIDKGDYLPPRAEEVARALDEDPDIGHVIVVHCETSSGILNPVEEIAAVVHARGRKLLIDSMSALGAIPLDAAKVPFEAVVSSANKCIEGVPGFGFVIARKEALRAARGRSHSLSLDLHAQWAYMEETGQWRFTPPTHVVAAFLEALGQHRAEGGVSGRLARYVENRDTLVEGMRALGFETLLADRWLSPIIVTFFNPADPRFAFQHFYDLMKGKGFIIYPGKLTVVDSFRIGCIGRLDASVMRRVVKAVGESLEEMGVASAAPPASALEEKARLAA